jgi:hypothetical protein
VSNLLLTIELVPKSSWMNNVRRVLTTSQWDALRGMVCGAVYNVCQICGDTGPKHPVECHEIWDYNEKTLVRKLTGMIALCPNCHMVKHFGFAQVQGKEELALKHLMKVNKLKKKEAEAYVEEAFETWSLRSQQKWKLDLSILKKYGIDPDKLENL